MGMEKLEQKLQMEIKINKKYGPGKIGIRIMDNAFYLRIKGRPEEHRLIELNQEEIEGLVNQ